MWLESIPSGDYITSIQVAGSVKNGVSIKVESIMNDGQNFQATVSAASGLPVVAFSGVTGVETVAAIPDAQPSPFVYELQVRVGNDVVTSFFGLRESSLGVPVQHPRRTSSGTTHN